MGGICVSQQSQFRSTSYSGTAHWSRAEVGRGRHYTFIQKDVRIFRAPSLLIADGCVTRIRAELRTQVGGAKGACGRSFQVVRGHDWLG